MKMLKLKLNDGEVLEIIEEKDLSQYALLRGMKVAHIRECAKRNPSYRHARGFIWRWDYYNLHKVGDMYQLNNAHFKPIVDLEGEKWLPVKGFEGRYSVSNKGRIKRLAHSSGGGTNSIRDVFLPENLLKGWKDSRKGYMRVEMMVDGKAKGFAVHRLVAIAFVPNPNNLPEVNHIDEVKLNNIASNLEWSSPKDNANHGSRNSKISEGLSMNVVQLSMDGKHPVKVHESVRATVEDGFRYKSVTEVTGGRMNSHRGFKWMLLHVWMMKNYTRKIQPVAGTDFTFRYDPCNDPLYMMSAQFGNDHGSNAIVVFNPNTKRVVRMYDNIKHAVECGYNKYSAVDFAAGYRPDPDGNRWFYYKNLLTEIYKYL